MPETDHASYRRVTVQLAAVAVLAALLAACAPSGGDELVHATAPTITSTFQGQVTSIDARAGAFVVEVRIVWVPELQARREARRVLVGAGEATLGDLRLGDEVQVSAEPSGDDWRASKVQLFDVD